MTPRALKKQLEDFSIMKAKKDLIWNEKLLKHKRHLECIGNFGSLEDALTMIESGEQGSPLQERVASIRMDQSPVGVGTLHQW